MAKHAAPEAPADVPRASLYPIFIDQPMHKYLVSDSSDNKASADRIKTKLVATARDTLGLTVTSKMLTQFIANPDKPLPDDPQTYVWIRFGVFFENVSADELHRYKALLEDVLSDTDQRVYTHPEYDLPAPEVFVPTGEQVAAERKQKATLIEQGKKIFNDKGEVDPEKLRVATAEYRKKMEAEMPASRSSATAGQTGAQASATAPDQPTPAASSEPGTASAAGGKDVDWRDLM